MSPGNGPRTGRRALLAAGAGMLLIGALPARAAGASRASVDVDSDLPGDRHAIGAEHRMLRTVLARLSRVQRTVGHGNFHLLGFDRMLRVARNYDAIGAFAPAEIEYLERLFHFDARIYGFYGERVYTRLTENVPVRDVVGVGRQRLLHGASEARFARMRAQIGERLVLTSGIRSLVKQMHLFLAKAERVGGNLSRASRSLAPPGYSYHAVGDFDVGERGLGAGNFTLAFARTETYRRLLDAGALPMRYPLGNRLGVRFEPWHVRVV